MAMMRDRDLQTQEDGFGFLNERIAEYLDELIAELETETDPSLRCWLLELIAHSKNPQVYPILARFAQDEDESLQNWAIRGLRDLDTREARRLLYELGAK